jgi:hypothetical protein
LLTSNELFCAKLAFIGDSQKAHVMKIIAAGLLALSLCSAGMAVTTTLASARPTTTVASVSR